MKTKCQTLGYILDKKLQKILIISIFAPSISEFQADSIWPISILLCWCREILFLPNLFRGGKENENEIYLFNIIKPFCGILF